MKRSDLLLSPDSETLYRVLDVTEGEVLVVNCIKKAIGSLFCFMKT